MLFRSRQRRSASVAGGRCKVPVRGYGEGVRRIPRWFDIALAAVLFIGGSLQVLGAQRTAPLALDLALAVLVTVPLALRRIHPVPVFVVVAGATFVAGVVEQASADLLFVPPLLVASFTVGAHVKMPAAVVAPAGLTVMAIAGVATRVTPVEDAPFALLLFGGAWVAGLLLRMRDQQVAAIAADSARREARQDAEWAAAVAAERARIARELHDVIAHSISVIAIQAQACRQGTRGERPGQGLNHGRADQERRLELIEQTAREAMTELRQMLGVLRAEGEPPELAPQPGLGQLGELVEQSERAGAPVHLEVDGDLQGLPPGVELMAYRIVQEALTNVRKHTQGAHTRVRVRRDGPLLCLDVRDDGGRGPEINGDEGTGHGLIGMRERVLAYGGTITTGPAVDGRGYVVQARLPVPTEEAP